MIIILNQKKKKKFLEEGFNLSFLFATYCTKKIKISFFEEMFNGYKFFDSNIKIINKKYIENCNKKYAD